ncbi:hypothetical protein B0O99DRAFT_147474 [Bisporella sp. PMI_857]|nr:hypothetical protein B0O99DRAFT_147474 [Bisporella sp. PMI_857]
MAKVIISLCANFVDECEAEVPDGKEPLLQIFASSIGTVSHEETRLFKSFKLAVEKRETEQKVGNGKHKETALTALLEELYLHKEIELMEEIKDIRDELKIIRGVFEEQKYVLQGLSKALVEGQKETNSDALYSNLPELNNLITRLEQVEKMEEDAKTTYKSLNHLLDLKQKQANLIEAAGARSEAVESGKQAKTVLFFTIVTIIFLPLSFLTSLFALNIRDFPHDASGEVLFPSRWIYSRIFGTTAAISVPMIGIAISINNLLDMFKKENVKKNIKTARTENFPRIRRWFARTNPIEYDAEKLK